MKNVEDLINQFEIIQEMFNKEKDPEAKEIHKERILELAYRVGKMAQKQATGDEKSCK